MMSLLPPHMTEDSTPSGELRVLILGPLRRLLKVDTLQMPYPSDGSQNAFWESMLERFPEIRSSRSSVRLARDSHFLLPDEILNPGDEVALIPPVSGG
jgi:molybdopterin converting factor small subunit